MFLATDKSPCLNGLLNELAFQEDRDLNPMQLFIFIL